MKLHEAIRLGGMSTKQATGRLLADDGGTCALGSAMSAVGILDRWKADMTMLIMLRAQFPIIETFHACPTCGMAGGGWMLDGIIVHLNDFHLWTREQIADFVEGIERNTQVAQVSKQEEAIEVA